MKERDNLQIIVDTCFWIRVVYLELEVYLLNYFLYKRTIFFSYVC